MNYKTREMLLEENKKLRKQLKAMQNGKVANNAETTTVIKVETKKDSKKKAPTPSVKIGDYKPSNWEEYTKNRKAYAYAVCEAVKGVKYDKDTYTKASEEFANMFYESLKANNVPTKKATKKKAPQEPFTAESAEKKSTKKSITKASKPITEGAIKKAVAAEMLKEAKKNGYWSKNQYIIEFNRRVAAKLAKEVQ